VAKKQLRRVAVVFALVALAVSFGKVGNPGHGNGAGNGNGHPQTGLWEGPL
jgi:hypothetical protein